jgi:hypothetical protein
MSESFGEEGRFGDWIGLMNDLFIFSFFFFFFF